MCPVNRSTLRVPLIFSEKPYFVANLERDNSRCQVNVVGNQECLARSQLNDKSLMPASVVVVRKEPSDRSVSLDLYLALVLCEGASLTLVLLVPLVTLLTLVTRFTYATLANGDVGIDHRRRCARPKSAETDKNSKQTEFHMRGEILSFHCNQKHAWQAPDQRIC